MSRHAATRRSALRASALIAGAALVAVLVTHLPATYAVFTDVASVSGGTAASPGTAFTSGSIATPAISSTTQTPTTNAVAVTWTATAVGSGGATATAYEVYRYTGATGGTGTLVCGTSGALTCSDTTTAPTTTVYYALRARFATNWVNISARVAYNPDVTGPTVVITSPINTCSGTTVACGTAADTGGVSKIEYTLLRARTPLLSATTYTCWNGAAYVAANTGNTCSFQPATGTTTWTVPGAKATAYPAAPVLGSQSFVLTVRATDGFGNVSTTTSNTLNN